MANRLKFCDKLPAVGTMAPMLNECYLDIARVKILYASNPGT